MDFSKYIFRSHMVGKIISSTNPLTELQKEKFAELHKRFIGEGNPLTQNQEVEYISLRNKDNESRILKLNDSAKKVLNDIVYYEKFNRRELLDNKYLKKGIEREKEARDLISKVTGILLVKDDERRSNEWVTGKRDINFSKILDVKTSYSLDTFYAHLIEKANEIYLDQLDCYMDLWDIKESILCHCLVDTTVNMVNSEIRSLGYKLDIFDLGGEVYEDRIEDVKKVVCNHIFTRKGLEEFCNQSNSIHIEWFTDFIEIPESERVHMIEHQFDKARIEQRNEFIKLAREYMNKEAVVKNRIIKL